MAVRAQFCWIIRHVAAPKASPPSASTANGARSSSPALCSWANIDGVVSIMSRPNRSIASTSAPASR
ncbi:Uncharacterised protein [Mycobacterium tuberculosis]|uniref:Uncharacterized protein n=1 Tax=Mycobacterium tuberculosis TaxID=1773 RepID=A0A0U0S695_MYCTX|nr:Uncharacterised protein [Mycobacterium tuberculosis]CKQ60807.1 Uncharacterised protein [Mycobacterium tuberculosis]CKT49998.1 Uncharacterised protein [Mycobacterium tuberculosis]CNV93504.1 Uncharacterised protein [Mycobacterium tuberculosis]COV56212.1 Uncharacterised protein [Mycobacterium tuberculosis]